MTPQEQWTIYFAGIVSIRLHPKNVPEATPALTEFELNAAYDIANRMLELTEERWRG